MKIEPMVGNAPWQMVILVITFVMHSAISPSQSRIANTNIQLKDNKIHITYDIENSKRSDRYKVRLEVTDSTGSSLLVSTVEGDLGENVSGGNRKEIIWDLKADGIQMDADIYFQLYADAIRVSEPEVPKEAEEKVKSEFNRAGIILQSLVFPGLGLTRVTGNPHWLKGVAGYGCILGAVLLNERAMDTYEQYKTPNSAEEASSYLADATMQDNVSEVLAYAAIGIWVTDIIWTIVGTSDLKKSVTVGTNYDPQFGVPLLTFRYKF